MSEKVDVYVALRGDDVHAGTMHVTTSRVLSVTFQYSSMFLARGDGYAIDPSLPLIGGPQHTKGLPGAFADAAPDRWGRNLIAKRMRVTFARTLTDLDYLLGVSDVSRQGALRFRRGSGPFLAADADVPKLIALPRLLRAAERVARAEDHQADIQELLDAGTGSLGGARPKASILDGDALSIAKFPHPGDRWDVMAWEAVALRLAAACGIPTPPSRLVHVDGAGVLILRRFDRQGDSRVGYVSGMTMAMAQDGDVVDYLELSERVAVVAKAPHEELRALWRRIAFGVLINNTDDHLRNIGFLRVAGGWSLAPTFDLNPNPEATERQTGVGGARDRLGCLAALDEHAAEFALTQTQARQQLDELSSIVQGAWRGMAQSAGVARREIELLEPAFTYDR